MMRLDMLIDGVQPLNILCLGAHSDDIEIGCGGTILRIMEEKRNVEVYWIVFGAGKQRKLEAKRSAKLFLEKAKKRNIITLNFRDGFFPYNGTKIKEYFEQLKTILSSPDLIFTHHRHDLHQDHRLICELTWNTFRDNLILEYEIVKYDGDLGSPNFFVHLPDSICSRKIDYIKKCFRSQAGRHWFDDEVFRSLLRLRGIESNAPQKYAEGFYGRKVVV